MSNKTGPVYISFIVFLTLITCRAPEVVSSGHATVMAVVSHNIKPYEEALEGFEGYFAEHGIGADVEIVAVQGDVLKAREAIERKKSGQCSLILALGSVAASAVKDFSGKIPVVAGLLLDPGEINEGMTGVTIEIPLEAHLQWLTKILPGARNIGIMYSPGKNSQKVESAAEIARDFNLRTFTYRVERPADIPEALESLSRKVDAFFGIIDDLIYTQQTAKHILLFSLKNRIPFIGLSENWVKAGALYSLDCSYRDIGVQCAELSRGILEGKKQGSIKLLSPRKIVYSVNLKTANHMKIDISEAIVEGAHEVFR